MIKKLLGDYLENIGNYVKTAKPVLKSKFPILASGNSIFRKIVQQFFLTPKSRSTIDKLLINTNAWSKAEIPNHHYHEL